jgi:hypothetical protein
MTTRNWKIETGKWKLEKRNCKAEMGSRNGSEGGPSEFLSF